ncbi:MAG: divergent polysaccharide deacetylase family protein [Dictyoglomaceae bacterium]
MEKKIRGIILMLLFTFILLLGCKKEEKIESPPKKLIPLDLNIDISNKIFTDIHKNFSEDIRELEVIVKEEEISNYKLSWNQYKIYWTKSWEDLKEKITSELSKRELKYKIQELNHFKKLTASYSYILPTGENINLDFFYFYFPIKKEKISKNLRRPLLAIVVDDLTEKNYWSNRLFSLTYTLNLAIIPTSHARELAEEAKKKDWYVIMHTPMESISYPKDAKYLISYPIMAGMSKEEIRRTIEKNLSFFKDFPIEGINNHMGSKVTSDPETMKNLYEVLKEKNLFFLDSKTSYKSVGSKMAQEVKIPFLENNLFLDHENNMEKIRQRFKQAVEIAKRRGKAVVICHIRPTTIEVLEELEKEDFFKDVELVKLKDLLPGESYPPLEE